MTGASIGVFSSLLINYLPQQPYSTKQLKNWCYRLNVCDSQNSYDKIVTPNVIVLEGGASGE